MKSAESRVGLVACACRDRHTTLGSQKCGYFMLIFVGFLFFGLFLPYLTTAVRNTMPAFLPFISQAGGSPPATGVFAVFLVIAAFFGTICFPLCYETIKHRNVKNMKLINYANRMNLLLGGVAMLGIIVVIANPVGYIDVPNKFEYAVTVLYEHSLGALMILVGGAFFQIVLAAIYWYIPDATKMAKYTRASFVILYIIIFFIIVYPMPAFIVEQMGSNPLDFAAMKKTTYSLPTKFSTNYIICAVCEWAIGILAGLNFLTLYKDLQRVSCRIVLRHRTCLEEEEEPVPTISLKVLS